VIFFKTFIFPRKK